MSYMPCGINRFGPSAGAGANVLVRTDLQLSDDAAAKFIKRAAIGIFWARSGR